MPECHLLQQMSSQSEGHKNYFKYIGVHELTAYLSIFNLSKLWAYYQKHVNQIILNYTIFYIPLQISETFVQILLIMNLSLNQTLLTFLLCV